MRARFRADVQTQQVTFPIFLVFHRETAASWHSKGYKWHRITHHAAFKVYKNIQKMVYNTCIKTRRLQENNYTQHTQKQRQAFFLPALP
jgi:hypothetical protein